MQSGQEIHSDGEWSEEKERQNKSVLSRVQRAGTEAPRRVTDLSPATGQRQIGENSEQGAENDQWAGFTRKGEKV